MIVCEIKKVLPYNTYELKAGDSVFNTVLEFYGVTKPSVADKLMIHEKLFNTKWQGYSQPYAFEVVEDMTPNEVKNLNHCEFIVLGSKGKNYVLKRVYG